MYGRINHHRNKQGKMVYTWNREQLTTWGSCNYCVNHWGTDICQCGSGKKYQKCHGKPAQSLGKQKVYSLWNNQ
jgi:hypothetical protein